MYIKSWSEIDTKAPEYYDKILQLCENTINSDKNLAFIVVDHCLQTFESHVTSLAKLGKIAGVILKSSTRQKEAEDFAKRHCPLLKVTKEDLMIPDVATNLILEHTSSNQQVIILDHGGYFAASSKQIVAHPVLRSRVLGIVEVTENGHHKYEKIIAETPISLISIARTEIKELEDMQVGVSICDASNTILYSVHAALDSMQTACVLGYGKIGRSIANSLGKRGISQVTVVEIDTLRAQLALKEGHSVVMAYDKAAKINAFQKSQIIFSATGSKALTKEDIGYLRKAEQSDSSGKKVVTFIASCTSPDDEFSPDFFEELHSISKNSAAERLQCESEYKLSPYELYDGRQINVLNGGKAVNFAIGGTPGYEICQVWAAILFSVAKIASRVVKPAGVVQTLTRQEQLAIGKITQSVFFTEPREVKTVVVDDTNRIRRHSLSSFSGTFALFKTKETQEIGQSSGLDVKK